VQLTRALRCFLVTQIITGYANYGLLLDSQASPVKTRCSANWLLVVLLGGTFPQGKFEELEPGKRLVFSWRFNNWEDGCFSKVCW
jgi:hypothetical protein